MPVLKVWRNRNLLAHVGMELQFLNYPTQPVRNTEGAAPASILVLISIVNRAVENCL